MDTHQNSTPKAQSELEKLNGIVFDFSFKAGTTDKPTTLHIAATDTTGEISARNIEKSQKITDYLDNTYMQHDKPLYKYNHQFADKLIIENLNGSPLAVMDFAENSLSFNQKALENKSYRKMVGDLYLKSSAVPDANAVNFNDYALREAETAPNLDTLDVMKRELFDSISREVQSGFKPKYQGIDLAEMEKGLQPVAGVQSMTVSNGHIADELDESEDFAKKVLKGDESERKQDVQDYAEAIEKAAKRKRMALEEIALEHGYFFKTTKFKDEFINKDTGRVDLIHKHNPLTSHSSLNLRTFTPEAVATQAAACFATFKDTDNVYFNFKNMSDEQAIAQTKLSLSKFYEAGFDYERLILPKTPEILRVIRQDYIDALATQSISNINEEAIEHAQKMAEKQSQNPSDLDTSQAQRAIEEAALKVKEELVEKQKFDAHKKPVVDRP